LVWLEPPTPTTQAPNPTLIAAQELLQLLHNFSLPKSLKAINHLFPLSNIKQSPDVVFTLCIHVENQGNSPVQIT
jgi:hypothetical protein